jgi:hypothetical protein
VIGLEELPQNLVEQVMPIEGPETNEQKAAVARVSEETRKQAARATGAKSKGKGKR